MVMSAAVEVSASHRASPTVVRRAPGDSCLCPSPLPTPLNPRDRLIVRRSDADRDHPAHAGTDCGATGSRENFELFGAGQAADSRVSHALVLFNSASNLSRATPEKVLVGPCPIKNGQLACAIARADTLSLNLDCHWFRLLERPGVRRKGGDMSGDRLTDNPESTLLERCAETSDLRAVRHG